MNAALRERFERLALRLTELDATLADPAVAADIKRYLAVSREQAEVAGVVETWRRYQQRERDLDAAEEMQASEPDGELAELAREEAAAAGADLERLAAELHAALVPKDPDDARNAFLEIRAGTGGDESALFAGDLARMYLRWCERAGLRTEVMSE
ncbi:MAG: PCRF domain-containing protein, partial [Rubrivivax sp.]|nr:PCRF domain-containing protein [Rubrivivax sp.]